MSTPLFRIVLHPGMTADMDFGAVFLMMDRPDGRKFRRKGFPIDCPAHDLVRSRCQLSWPGMRMKSWTKCGG